MKYIGGSFDISHIPHGLCTDMTLALICDTHDLPVPGLFDALRAAAPDAILLAGDILECGTLRRGNEEALKLIGYCAATAPTFFSPGNHERRMTDDDRSRIESAGAMLLEDADVVYGGLRIGGLSASPDAGFVRRFAAKPGEKLLICHRPELYNAMELNKLDIDLVVSGHAHGGQWRVFERGVFAPNQGLFPRYTRGRYGRLIVSPGLSNPVHVPRFGNPMQLLILDA